MARHVLHLWEFEFVSFMSDQYVTGIPEKAVEGIEAGDLLEINWSSAKLFVGRVCDVWDTDLGTQIIHATATSVSSSS